MSNPDVNLNEVILKINETIKARLEQADETKLTDAAQEELGKVVNLVQRIEQAVLLLEQKKASRRPAAPNFLQKQPRIINDDPKLEQKPLNYRHDSFTVEEEKLSSILKYLEVAVHGLCQNPPNLVLSKNIRRQIRAAFDNQDYGLRGKLLNFGRGVIYLSSAPAKVLFGLILALPFYIIIPILLTINIEKIAQYTWHGETQLSRQKILAKKTAKVSDKKSTELIEYEKHLSLLLLAGSAGAVGSIISILTRIKEYDSPEYTDAFLPLVIGVFKPIIGAAFGILIVTIIHSEFLPLSVKKDPAGSREYFFFSVAFIIGFSERFAVDIVSRTENAITGSRAASDTKEEKKS